MDVLCRGGGAEIANKTKTLDTHAASRGRTTELTLKQTKGNGKYASLR